MKTGRPAGPPPTLCFGIVQGAASSHDRLIAWVRAKSREAALLAAARVLRERAQAAQ